MLYKDLTEDTLALKIIKVRKIHNLEREDFADLIGYHLTSVNQWETQDVPPNPQAIKSICDKFDVSLSYFHNYYNIYYSNPGEILRRWKNKNKLTYEKAAELLNISRSAFARLLSAKIKLSYDMYLKLVEINIL